MPAFIPDAGMLGTVFIHAVANLQSTFATNVTLTITAPRSVEFEQAYQACVHRSTESGGHNPAVFDGQSDISTSRRVESEKRRQRAPETSTITLDLDSLQYGQSRDLFLKYHRRPLDLRVPVLQCRLSGRPVNGSLLEMLEQKSLEMFTAATPALAYHRFRGELCSLLYSMFPLNSLEEHQVTSEMALEDCRAAAEALASRMQKESRTEAQIQTLWDDLVGPDPSGQIRLALSSTAYFERWGKHYLLSILNAHQKQICNSFKDNGPLQYGRNSPLFVKCRDDLDRAFDNLPPPVPSRPLRARAQQVRKSAKVDMRRYHRRDNPCFAAESTVVLASGLRIPVKNLRPGMMVNTIAGESRVAAVVATDVDGMQMCTEGDLVVTPWHPILVRGAWCFPADVLNRVKQYTGTVYSIMLERSAERDMHTVEVSGIWAATLGHGVVEAESDARAHAFFGDYDAVEGSLAQLPSDESGHLRCRGIGRSRSTGLASCFLPQEQAQVTAMARL